jgi:hypothetical protein
MNQTWRWEQWLRDSEWQRHSGNQRHVMNTTQSTLFIFGIFSVMEFLLCTTIYPTRPFSSYAIPDISRDNIYIAEKVF